MKRSHSARVFRSVCRSSVSLVIVALMAFAARAEEFDWRDVAGYNWNSSVKDQADWGTCWAHGPVATLEAKYKITRNDPLFELDLSEEQLIAETDPMDFGTTNGGSYSTMAQPYDYFRDHGIVTETELPYVGDEFNGTDPRDLGLWPLAAGWENRVVKSVSCATFSDTLDAWKTTLKMYGPRAFGINGGTHVVTLVGFRDDANLPGGGYWIYKNSWGPNQGDAGYNTVNYDDTGIVHYDLFALTGGAYYSGALATATWNGGAGTWTVDGTNWNSGAYAWENKETAATFGGSGGAVTISGQAIAHSVTINSGSTGYTFSGGGLTVTAGGITANESATINGPVTVGAPQTWTVASGKTLAVNGDLHTVISDLTINGPGTVAVSGSIDGGGVINTIGGAAPGNITVTNSAYLWLDGAGDYLSNINAAAGSHGIAFDQDTGEVGHCYGVLSGSGYIDKYNHAGTVIFHATNTYTNWTSIYGGAVQADSGVGLPSASFLNLDGGVLQSNGTVTFTRSLGTSGSNKFQWNTNGGGFAAGAGAMTVRVNNGTGTLTWGTTVGTNIVGTLKFGSETAGNVVTFQNGINLNAATRTIDVQDNPETGADYAVISGVISYGSGTAGLTKTGPGTLVLTATNTYNGTTTISGGALQANNGAGLPSTRFLSLDGGVLQSNSAVTFSRSLGTSGSTFQFTSNGGGFSAGAGAMTVRINNGTSTINWNSTGNVIKGTLKFGSGSAANVVTLQNGINLNGATRTIQVDDNPTTDTDYAVISGVISNSTGTGNLIKSGAGMLKLTATSTYNGTTTIAGGALQADFGAGVPTGSFLTLDGGVLQSNSAQTFTRALGSSGGTFRWTAGGGGFAAGAGTMTVNVGNGAALTWGTTVGSQLVGTLKLNSATATNVTTFQNAVNLNNGDRTIQVDNNFDTSADYAVMSGVISGTGNLTKTGAGRLDLTGSDANTYSGTVTITGGVLRLNKTSGLAITGNLNLISDEVQNNYVYLHQSDQIASSAVVSFVNTSSRSSRFILLGHNQTLSGISCSDGLGVIQNSENESDISTTGTLTVNNTTDCFYNGYLRNKYTGSSTGLLSLVKNGSGTLTLAGSNIYYTGGTTVSGGELVLEDVTHSTFLATSITNNAALEFINDAADTNFSGVISGSGTLEKTGSGVLTLSGASGNTYTGTTTITAGTLRLNKTSGVAIGGNLNMAGNGLENNYVYLDQSNQIASSAVITFGATATTSSRLNLLGHAQTVAGISCSTGRGVIQNSEYASGISANGELTINNSADYSYNGYLRDKASGDSTGKVALVKTGAGTQTLSGGNISYTGGTTVSGGKLLLQNTTNATFLATNVTNNATLEFNNTSDINYSGVVSGSGALLKSGSATLTLSGAGGNTYSGATTITAGKLRLNKSSGVAIPGNLNVTPGASANVYIYLDGSDQIASSSVLTFVNSYARSGRFMMLGHNQTVAGISCSDGLGVIQNTENESGISTTGTLTVNNTTDCSYNGYLRNKYTGTSTGLLSLVKTGTGTLTLAGNYITHTGGTTVGGGTLSVIADTIASSVTVNSGGTFAPGVHDLHEVTTGAAAWNNGGEYLWEINDANGTAGTNWDVWNVTGDLAIASTFTIDVDTLNGTSAGSMADFNNQSSYAWLLAETTGTITGFANLALDTSGFQNALDPEGYLYLSQSGNNQLYLNYSPTGGDGFMPPSIPGDANGNSRVDESDAAILATNWGQAGDWTKGDFNGDGMINALDASILAANWSSGIESNPVPEPGVFVLLIAMGILGLLRRRRAGWPSKPAGD